METKMDNVSEYLYLIGYGMGWMFAALVTLFVALATLGAVVRCCKFVARPKKPVRLFDLVVFLQDQRKWSIETFGPGERTDQVVDHIYRELGEVLENPEDPTEWIDIVILAFDGAMRTGNSPREVVKALIRKAAVNRSRSWPDWRTAEPGEAIEHIKKEG
jgi:hypothetical protein